MLWAIGAIKSVDATESRLKSSLEQRLVSKGMIRFRGITGIVIPDTIIETLNGDPKPYVIQVISNLLDPPGILRRCPEDAKPRGILTVAMNSDGAVMGIRAVQARALTSQIDRKLPDDHREDTDHRRAERFTELAKELGETAVELAHCYVLSMDGVLTVAMGVKNRRELRRTGIRKLSER